MKKFFNIPRGEFIVGRDAELRSMEEYRKLAMAMARMETGTILTERLWTEVVEIFKIQIV